MSAPTPEDVAREIVRVERSEAGPLLYVGHRLVRSWLGTAYEPTADDMAEDVRTIIAAALRAARAAAIEEAARVADADAKMMSAAGDRAFAAGRMGVASHRETDVTTAERIAKRIRALGEESAAPREEATS